MDLLLYIISPLEDHCTVKWISIKNKSKNKSQLHHYYSSLNPLLSPVLKQPPTIDHAQILILTQLWHKDTFGFIKSLLT